jgi:tetratricopeptide (TPR) repeat protein
MSGVQTLALPTEFWERGDVTDLLDRRDIGGLLGLVLDECGLSQHAFGALGEFTQTQISLWIRHKHEPTLDTVARLADKLCMSSCARRRLGLSSPGTESVCAGLPPVKLHRVLALAEHIGRTGKVDVLDAWRDAVKPRGSMEPWHDLARLIAKQRPPAEPFTETMALRTRGFYLIAARLPARLVIRALTAHVHELTLLLNVVSDERLRRDLTVAGGESSYLAACCDVDLGDFPGALDRLDTIAAAAAIADDKALAAMAIDGQSHFQAAQGHHHRALQLVNEAREACPPDVSPGTVAYLWLHTAEEHACLDHTAEAAWAWRQAEEHYVLTDVAADRPWILLWLSRDCFESVKAVIYASTGRPREAAAIAGRIVIRLRGRDGKADAVCLVNASLALARVGLYKSAAIAGRDALHAVRASAASGYLPRAGEVAAILNAHADSVPEVVTFLRDLAATRVILKPVSCPDSDPSR